jgi:hypothetical protein
MLSYNNRISLIYEIKKDNRWHHHITGDIVTTRHREDWNQQIGKVNELLGIIKR